MPELPLWVPRSTSSAEAAPCTSILERWICSAHLRGYLQRLNDGTDRDAPYLDPVGIPTIGYGSIWWTDGRRVQMADRGHHAGRGNRADAARAATEGGTRPHRLYRGTAPPVHGQGGPVLHLQLRRWCSPGLRIADGDQSAPLGDVPAEFAKWRMGGGKVLPGLVRRRKAEADLFMEGVRLMRTTQGENDNGGWTATVLRAA